MPYGLIVLLALADDLTLPCPRRFLASALLLGPLTLLRPLVAAAGLVEPGAGRPYAQTEVAASISRPTLPG